MASQVTTGTYMWHLPFGTELATLRHPVSRRLPSLASACWTDARQQVMATYAATAVFTYAGLPLWWRGFVCRR